MKSVQARAFLSRSFAPEFEKIVQIAEAICDGLDISTFCVDTASSESPIQEAKELVSKADFLIALCGQNDTISGSGKFITSQSVRDEITTATAVNKPVICFQEKDVSLKGFAASMFTYKTLEDFRNPTPDDIKELVRGIHTTKLKAVNRDDLITLASGIVNYYCPRSVMEIELQNTPEGLCWTYITERIYKFEADHFDPIMHSAFCLERDEACKKPPLYKVEIFKNGSPATFKTEVVDSGPGHVELQSFLTPFPAKGDTVLVRERYQSPFLVPIHLSQAVKKPLSINNKQLQAYDGNYIVNRVEELIVRFKFPEKYSISNVTPVVSTFSTRLDHLNQSEMERLRDIGALKSDEFNGRQSFELRVDRPLYQYFYGLAWTIPPEADLPAKVAPERSDW